MATPAVSILAPAIGEVAYKSGVLRITFDRNVQLIPGTSTSKVAKIYRDGVLVETVPSSNMSINFSNRSVVTIGTNTLGDSIYNTGLISVTLQGEIFEEQSTSDEGGNEPVPMTRWYFTKELTLPGRTRGRQRIR